MKLTSYQKYRFLEIIPGAITWTTLILVLLLSFLAPVLMVYVAIIVDFYWLLRVAYFVIYVTSSWRQFRKSQKVDWFAKVQQHERWQEIVHLVFLPMVDEDIHVIRNTIEALKNSTYPTDKIIPILAGEERNEKYFKSVADQIRNEYEGVFYDIIVTVHPADIPGEVAAKGANLHWSGHRVKEYVDAKGWKYENCIVSSFDVDTVVDPKYFAYLTNAYLEHPNPTRSSYQPLALYNNNVWESPSFTRVVANSTTFWLMAELARPKPLWTFSSHAMSFKALVDVGFWQSDIVTEDSRIFLQCFIHYDGDYEVTPMYIAVSMDTAHAGKLWDTVKNLYKQQRRWAWGIEHFPYMIWHFWKYKKIGRHKWNLVFNLSEGMWSWATAPLLIMILGYLPLWMAGDVEKATVIAQNAPYVLQWLMTFAMVGIFISAILNVFLLPSKIPGNKFLKIGVIMVQWILLPLTLILFGSFSAIDAQTHLMTGRYLGFYTTKKVRKINKT
ncbi:MAG: glycosyltransferase family 2 protein [Candidatus Kerfeldbacteria bacterium]